MSQDRIKKNYKNCTRGLSNLRLNHISLESSISPYSKKLDNTKSYAKLRTKPSHGSNCSALVGNNSFALSHPKSSKLLKDTYVVKKIKIEEVLERKLDRDMGKGSEKTKFSILEKYFSEVIQNDKTFARILLKIKAGYDEKIGYLSVQNVDELLMEIQELRKSVMDFKEDQEELTKINENLGKENYKLMKTLEKTESLYLEVHEKLQKIYNTDLDNYSPSETNWKRIVSENKSIIKKYNQLKKENEAFSNREKQYINLIVEMKERGFPVKEVYENMNVDESVEVYEENSQFIEQESENEALVSGRPQSVEKPVGVPVLDLGFLSKDSSDYEYLSED